MTLTRDLVRADVAAVICDFAGYVLDLQPHEVAALTPATRLDADGLDIDSLALLELATAVAQFFRLHETELEDDLLRRRRVDGWCDTVLRAWLHGSRRLTFLTSGTTSTAVRCTHRWADLTQELDVHAAMFADRRRVVVLVAPRHIYGFLFGVLLPRWLGVPVVDARGVAPSRLAAFTQNGDLVVGFPLRWDLAAVAEGWPPNVTGVSSTGPIKAATVDTLRDQGLDRMVEVYGSTQTGGVAWRDDPGAPLRLYAHWSLREDDRLARAVVGSAGEAVLYDAPDVLERRGDGFDVLRRRDGAVQVAGVNVSCAHVEQVLREHHYVLDCAVRAMRGAEGSRLKVFIVLATGVDEPVAREALRAWFRSRLTAPETPGSIAFGNTLPRDPHGKLADWPARVGDGFEH